MKTHSHRSIAVSQPHPLCILGDASELDIEANASHIVPTALCIAKKTILMNWKSKNDLCATQYRNLLLNPVSLERYHSSVKNQLGEFDSLSGFH